MGFDFLWGEARGLRLFYVALWHRWQNLCSGRGLHGGRRGRGGLRRVWGEGEAGLLSGAERDIDFGEQAGIEQRAMF